ncbi:MAG: hypothetical protein AAGF01_22520 [Cyanobacteria bacterium P01_G01_bin.38]
MTTINRTSSFAIADLGDEPIDNHCYLTASHSESHPEDQQCPSFKSIQTVIGPQDSDQDFWRLMAAVRWQKLLTRLAAWLLAEIFLSYVGLDNLADYSEYLSDRRMVANCIVGQ